MEKMGDGGGGKMKNTPNPAGMIEYGIWTSKAIVWAHLHPYDSAAYFYSTVECQTYIEAKNLAPYEAKSKNGTTTGFGYLIGKSSPFIHRVHIPINASGIATMNDRQVGLRGQKIINEAIVAGKIDLRKFMTSPIVTPLETRGDQSNGRDTLLTYTITVEIKTETVCSENLFVQKAEGRHQPLITRDGRIELV